MYTFKNICFSFLMLGAISAFSATYYVDTNGSDANNGLSTSTPWQTLDKVSNYSNSPGFAVGDQVLFKRGQTFIGRLYLKSSGSSGNHIVIGAYGTGNKPKLSSIKEISGFSDSESWSLVNQTAYPNVWKMSMTKNPWRVWLNGTEYVEADKRSSNPLALIDSTYRWYYSNDDDYLYVWSPQNPASEYTTTSLGLQYAESQIFLYGASYITIQDIDTEGGWNGSIMIMNGSHDVIVQNCTISKGHNGILVFGIDTTSVPGVWTPNKCYNIYIRDNIVDCAANCSYNYEYLNFGEGIYFRSGVTDSEISGNTISDWGHANLNFFADRGDGIKRVKVFNNTCLGGNVSYCRGFSFNGTDGLTEDNEVYSNVIKNMNIPSQINCSDLYFHDNILDTVTTSPVKPYAAQGLYVYINDDWSSGENNIISNNLIQNCNGVGIKILNAMTSSNPELISGNLFENNVVKNCGLSLPAGYQHLDGAAMEIEENIKGAITENSFIGNELNGSCIFYKGKRLNISAFNRMHGHDDNVISENMINLAKGKTCTFSTTPNYAPCTDAGDADQLTDGVYYTGTGQLWAQQLYTVGWSWRTPEITIDLGQIRKIKGASFNTAAGTGQVYFPSEIDISVSTDGNAYTSVGDLVALSNTENGAPPAYGEYNIHRFKTTSLDETARYIKLTVTRTGQYIFSDEVEILGTDNMYNAARYKQYTMDPIPNYGPCTDSGDNIQLTDGIYYIDGANLWAQQLCTVGWSNRSPVITVDLGESKNIRGASFNTAAGISGVEFPAAINLEVSYDGVNFSPVDSENSDLVSRSNSENGAPPVDGNYHLHQYKTDTISAAGQYLRFTVTRTGQYVFSDEIEVLELENYSNIIEGKSYTMSTAPNYALCTDSGDTTQLTDGFYYTGADWLWTRLYTVGWQNQNPVITFDLGGLTYIDKMSFNTAAGVSGVYFPSAINIETSMDGITYSSIGDLVTLSNTLKGAPPAYGTYSDHCFEADNLAQWATHVRLTVTRTGLYVFVDEIKIDGSPGSY